MKNIPFTNDRSAIEKLLLSCRGKASVLDVTDRNLSVCVTGKLKEFKPGRYFIDDGICGPLAHFHASRITGAAHRSGVIYLEIDHFDEKEAPAS